MSENSTKAKKKLWIKLTIIFSSVIVGLGAILGGAILFFRLPVSSYYKASQKAFVIPEINNGYVAQGFHYDAESQNFILSGYMKDKSPSPIYLVNKDGELVKKVTLLNKNGSDYVGHGGGVAVNGEYLYLAGGSSRCVLVYSFTELLSANSGDKLAYKGAISLKASDTDYIENAFVTVVGDRLITGEFYRAKKYPTLDSHKLTTKAGDYNQALAVEFALDDQMDLGVNPTPVKAYSMPDQVQGLEVYNGKIYLSTSWGLSFSHIYEYQESLMQNQGDITVLGKQVQLFAMDNASLTNTYKIPPMSEEMAFVDGLLYINCESASNKYIFGKFTGGKYLYKTDLSKLA